LKKTLKNVRVCSFKSHLITPVVKKYTLHNYRTSMSEVCELILKDWTKLLLTTFYDFLIGLHHFKTKRKKSCL